jgi:hypothetical protein
MGRKRMEKPSCQIRSVAHCREVVNIVQILGRAAAILMQIPHCNHHVTAIAFARRAAKTGA